MKTANFGRSHASDNSEARPMKTRKGAHLRPEKPKQKTAWKRGFEEEDEDDIELDLFRSADDDFDYDEEEDEDYY